MSLSGCASTETDNSSENIQYKENSLKAEDFVITKFYQRNTGELIYSIYGLNISSSAMIDSDGTEKISKNFLQKIQVVEPNKINTTIVYKDNGNIIVITDGHSSGSLNVQKPNEDIQ